MSSNNRMTDSENTPEWNEEVAKKLDTAMRDLFREQRELCPPEFYNDLMGIALKAILEEVDLDEDEEEFWEEVSSEEDVESLFEAVRRKYEAAAKAKQEVAVNA